MRTYKHIALSAAAVASIAVAAPTISKWEGLELVPYQDVGGVWTVCHGETNVEMQRYTPEQCEQMLHSRLPEYYEGAMAYVDEPESLPITFRAAVVSFTYNVGVGAFSQSTMLKKINRKDLKGACAELDKWVYVARMRIKGLENRRAAEKKLCLAEL